MNREDHGAESLYPRRLHASLPVTALPPVKRDSRKLTPTGAGFCFLDRLSYACQVNARLVRVFVDEDGFEVVSAGGTLGTSERYEWKTIREMVAYKRDCFGYDLICVALNGGAGSVEITEEVDGFDSFIEAAERALPGPTPVVVWHLKVAQP